MIFKEDLENIFGKRTWDKDVLLAAEETERLANIEKNKEVTKELPLKGEEESKPENNPIIS